jgi:hypothetical protein
MCIDVAAAESTNSRVMWLSFLEMFSLIAIAVFQLAYIRNWFSDKNYGDKRRVV